MRSTLLVALLGGIVTMVSAQDPKSQNPQISPSPLPSGTLATDDEKAIYALGLSLWHTLAPLDLSPAEVEILKRGLSDGVEGKPAISLQESAPQIDALRLARAQRATENEKARSAAFLEAAEKQPGAVKFTSGLVFFDVQPGKGKSPHTSDTVKIHYRGTLVDGTEFDNSFGRGQPAQLSLDRVIRCWSEGVPKMKVGGKARLLCPSSIAYGDRGYPSTTPGQQSILGGAALIYEVELIEIVKPSPKPSPKPSSGPDVQRTPTIF